MYQLIKQSFQKKNCFVFSCTSLFSQTRRLCCTFGYPLTDVVSILSFIKIPIFLCVLLFALRADLASYLTLLYARFYGFGIL